MIAQQTFHLHQVLAGQPSIKTLAWFVAKSPKILELYSRPRWTVGWCCPSSPPRIFPLRLGHKNITQRGRKICMLHLILPQFALELPTLLFFSKSTKIAGQETAVWNKSNGTFQEKVIQEVCQSFLWSDRKHPNLVRTPCLLRGYLGWFLLHHEQNDILLQTDMCPSIASGYREWPNGDKIKFLNHTNNCIK